MHTRMTYRYYIHTKYKETFSLQFFKKLFIKRQLSWKIPVSTNYWPIEFTEPHASPFRLSCRIPLINLQHGTS